VALMRAARSVARWSIHTITFQASSPEGLTLTGASRSSSTTSEHVASKPIPATAPGCAFAIASAARVAMPAARQMSADDCST